MGMDGAVEPDYDPVFVDDAGNPVAGLPASSIWRDMDLKDETIVVAGTALRLMDEYGDPVAGGSGISLTNLPSGVKFYQGSYAYGWIHLSPETGLHYRWAETAWFDEW